MSSLRGRLAVLLVLTAGMQASAPRRDRHLTDGEILTLSGRLRIVYDGWQRYLMLPVQGPYFANVGPDGGTKRITAVELNPQGNYGTVARYKGQIVTAKGKLRMEGASPYSWNGVMLMATSTKLPDGTVLTPAQERPQVPEMTKTYLVTVTMVPRHFEWQRGVIDLDSHRSLPASAIDGCGLNGGGDVMNCFCVDGFVPLRAGPVTHPLPADLWQQIPKSELPDKDMAQFTLPDPDAKKPQTFQVVCKRESKNQHE